MYLACILDASSQRCIGWHLSREMNTQMTSRALQQAIAERHPHVSSYLFQRTSLMEHIDCIAPYST